MELETGVLTKKQELNPFFTQTRLAKNWELLVVALVFVFYAARLFRLISRFAVNIFFSDQWAFDEATLFQQHSLWQMFTWQHGPHRQGLGALFAKVVEPLFHWNSRTESFVVGGVVFVAAVCALWLKRRLCGSLSIFDVLIPAIFFTPAQYESLFVTANFAHGPFPLLLVMLYGLAWTCQRNAVRYPLILIINFVTIYTGFGLFIGVLTPILLVLEHRASAAKARLARTYFAAAIIVSLASLGSFFIGYKLIARMGCYSFQPQSPKLYVTYLELMLASFFGFEGVGTLALVVGTTVLIALLTSLAATSWQVFRGQEWEVQKSRQVRPLIAAALIAYSLLFGMSSAYGRLCLGLYTSHASRYAIYIMPALFGLYLSLLGIHSVMVRRLLVASLLLVVTMASLRVRREMPYFPDIKLRWRSCYLQYEDVKKCDEAVNFPFSRTPLSMHVEEKLQFLKQTHQNLYSEAR